MKDRYIHATSLVQAGVYKQQYFALLPQNRAHLASFRMFGQIAMSTVPAVAAPAGPSLVQRAPTPFSINLGIASTLPANASQSLDPYFVSFSAEPAFLDEFLGSKSNPNTLTLQLISNIQKVTVALLFGTFVVEPSTSPISSIHFFIAQEELLFE